MTSAEVPQRTVFARITEVTFTPEDDPEWHRPITLEWRGGEAHCVKQGSMVWNETEQIWEYEPIPSSRDDAFIARTRYPFDQASDLAARLLAEQISAANEGAEPGCRCGRHGQSATSHEQGCPVWARWAEAQKHG